MVKEAKQNERGENNILLVFYEGSTSLRAMAACSRSFSKMLHGKSQQWARSPILFENKESGAA